MRLKLLLIIFLLWTLPAYSATYYVDGSASDDTGDGSYGSPKKYIQSGIGLMSGGDTLIIADGTYTGSTNMISSSNRPPDGSVGAYTTVQAETIGGVIIDGQGARTPILLDAGSPGPEYIIFYGLQLTNGLENQEGNLRIGYGNHIKVLNCSSYDAAPGAHLFSMHHSSYCLYEDCWAWGHAQYGYHYRDSDHCIARRCVARIDYATSSDAYVSSFFNYGSSYVEWQNCIAIDSDQGSYLDDNAAGSGGVFVMHSHNGYTNYDVNYRGCIILNCYAGNGGYFACNNANSTFNFQDCVIWGATGDNDNFYHSANGNSATPTWNHCVQGGNVVASGRGYYTSGAQEGNVSNSIATGATGYGLISLNSAEYTCLYDNGTNYTSVASTSNLITDVNPLTNSLLYLPRIESGSDLISAGSGGSYVGAQVTKKIGTSGTLWGDSGYATSTDDDLWPWPNEDKIKIDMAAYSGGGVSGARGFCASGKQLNGSDDITLTSYIWEYLGNQMPSDIYGVAQATHMNLVNRHKVNLH